MPSFMPLREDKRIRTWDYVEAVPKDLLSAVRGQGLEGIIGKQKDSHYQPGKRSGAWIKYRVNRGQEFVIGGYFPGPHGQPSAIYYVRTRAKTKTVSIIIWVEDATERPKRAALPPQGASAICG